MRTTFPCGASRGFYATDVAEEALAVLRALVARERLSNVTVIVGAAASTNLPAACCDLILVRNVYKLLSEPDEMSRSFAASLKPGGRLTVADFPPRPDPRVPLEVPANRGPSGILPEIVEREVGAVLRRVTIPQLVTPSRTPIGSAGYPGAVCGDLREGQVVSRSTWKLELRALGAIAEQGADRQH